MSRAPRPTGLTSGSASNARASASASSACDRDLEAVFAGVARAGREAGDAGDRRFGAAHERELGQRWREAADHRGGLRPLQRQQGVVGQRLDRAAAGDRRAQVRDVVALARGVDDQEEVVGATRHHQVVADAAGVVGEERVALLALGQADDVDRHQRLERGRRVAADQSAAGPCARRRTGPPTRGTGGARPGSPPDTRPACRSRRTAPSSRRARRAAHAAASSAARRSDRGRPWDRLRSTFHTRRTPSCPAGKLPQLSALPERLAAPRAALLAPSVGPLAADLSPARTPANKRFASPRCLSVRPCRKPGLRLRRLRG